MAELLPPVDFYGLEVAPGIYIPVNRFEELEAAMQSDCSIARAITEMHTCTVEVAPGIEVQRKDLEVWTQRMNTEPEFCLAMDYLMDRMNTDELCDATITLNLTPAGRKIVQRDLQLHRYDTLSFVLSQQSL